MSISASESQRWRAREMINKERVLISEAERKEVNQLSSSIVASAGMGNAAPERRNTPTLGRIPPTATFGAEGSGGGSGVGIGSGGGGGAGADTSLGSSPGSFSSLQRYDSGSWRPKPPAVKPMIQTRTSFP